MNRETRMSGKELTTTIPRADYVLLFNVSALWNTTLLG